MTNLIDKATNVRVSSVLNRDVSNFGKNHLTDGRPDTCWNSDQGTPQWICLDFSAPAAPSEIHLQFQGGFAGKEVRVETASSSGVAACCDVFPEDSNALQVFIGAGHPSGEDADSFLLKHRHVWPNCTVSSGCLWEKMQLRQQPAGLIGDNKLTIL